MRLARLPPPAGGGRRAADRDGGHAGRPRAGTSHGTHPIGGSGSASEAARTCAGSTCPDRVRVLAGKPAARLVARPEWPAPRRRLRSRRREPSERRPPWTSYSASTRTRTDRGSQPHRRWIRCVPEGRRAAPGNRRRRFSFLAAVVLTKVADDARDDANTSPTAVATDHSSHTANTSSNVSLPLESFAGEDRGGRRDPREGARRRPTPRLPARARGRRRQGAHDAQGHGRRDRAGREVQHLGLRRSRRSRADRPRPRGADGSR